MDLEPGYRYAMKMLLLLAVLLLLLGVCIGWLLHVAGGV